MKIWTRNLSHSKLLLVEETQTVSPADKIIDLSQKDTTYTQNMISRTRVKIDVRFISNSSFIPIRSRIEGWGLHRFKGNALNVITPPHSLLN